MSKEIDERFSEMKEKLLDLALDEVYNHSDLLKCDVKPVLKRSASQSTKKYENGKIIDKNGIDSIDLDEALSQLKQQSHALPSPEIVLSGRSRFHFKGTVGKIFATNIRYGVNDKHLYSIFGLFGPLKRAAINFNEDGFSIGTAFIVFVNKVDAQKAFQNLQGFELFGRNLCLRLIESAGMSGNSGRSGMSGMPRIQRRSTQRRKGDVKPVDNKTVFEDTEKLKEEDLINLDLDEYVRRRKRAKTWNYY